MLTPAQYEYANQHMRPSGLKRWVCTVCGLEVSARGRFRTGLTWGTMANHIIAKHAPPELRYKPKTRRQKR